MSNASQENLPLNPMKESETPAPGPSSEGDDGAPRGHDPANEQKAQKDPVLKRPIPDTSYAGSEDSPPRLDESIDFSNPQTWGDFEVQQVLGKGAMGTVYKGRQISLDRTVALKVLPVSLASDENFLRRFELEAKAVAKISSPHVVQVYAAGNHEGQEYFAMEFVEGMDLAARLEKGYKPSFKEALDIVQQVAHGLAAAAELHIIHRDIKPSNIMMTEKGLAKIMDFGLVKLTGSHTASLTMAGTLLGTVNYLSPEQGRGEDCDKRSDIYSLGVVLYELLTGRLPFAGDNPGSVIYQHNFVEPVLPREINPEIPKYHQAIVLKCLQKKADDRYQDPRELIADIDLIKKWKAPKTAKTFVNPSVLLADESLTKSSDFLSDEGEKPKEESVKDVSVPPPPKRPNNTVHILVASALLFIVIAGVLGLYKLNSTTHGLISIAQAEQLLADGKFLQCRDIIDANIAVSPDDSNWINLKEELDRQESEDLLRIANMQYSRGKFPASRESAERVLQFSPDNTEAKLLIRRLDDRGLSLENARQLLKEGKLEECRRIVKKNVDNAPNDLDWLKIFTQLNNEEGHQLLRTVKNDFYTNSYESIQRTLMRAIELLPDNNQAEQLLEKLNKRQHAAELVRSLLLKDQFSQSREVIEHNVRIDPNDPIWIKLRSELNVKEGESLLRKTRAEFQINNHELARKYITRALELIPNNKEAKQLYSALVERNHDLSLAQQLLDAGNYQQCREIVDRHVEISPKDHDWLKLRVSLNAKEGQSLLTAIQYDLNSFDYESAYVKLSKLTELMPENEEVLEIKNRLDERSKGLEKARGLIGQKEFSECRLLVEEYLELAPRDPGWLKVWNELNSEETQHKLLLARFAYSRQEFAAAQKIAEQVLNILPNNIEAKELLQQIDQRQITAAADPVAGDGTEGQEEDRKEFDSVYRTNHTDDNTTRQTTVPDEKPAFQSPTDDSGLGTQTYPFDNRRNIAARLNLLKRMLGDKDQDIAMVEEAVEDFIDDVGEEHDASGELRRGLEDRREEENMTKTLKKVDEAISNQNSEQLTDIIKVKEHVAALSSLMGQPGLLFEHHLHSFERNGDKAVIKVVVNHALLYMPPTDIYYRYEAQRKGYRWIITSVQMLDRLD